MNLCLPFCYSSAKPIISRISFSAFLVLNFVFLWVGQLDAQTPASSTQDRSLGKEFISQATHDTLSGLPLTNGLMACYPLNGNASDIGGAGLHGIMTTNVLGATDRFGRTNSAFRFTGTSSYIRVMNFVPNQSAFAAAVWVKPDKAGPLPTVQNILSKHGNPYDVQLLVRRCTDGKYGLRWSINGYAYCIGPSDTGVIDPSITNWDFIVVQYTGTSIQLYVNAQLIRQQAAVGSIATCTHTLTFGAYASYPEIECFQGLIDDITFFNRSLSQEDINTLYNSKIDTCSLTINNAIGTTASPTNGSYSYTSGSTATASVSSPVIDGSTCYSCTGVSVEGDVSYTLHDVTSVDIVMTNNASVTWNWLTRYRVKTLITGDGAITSSGTWFEEGEQAELTATAATGWYFYGWDGDTNACSVSGNRIEVPVTPGRSIRAIFVSNLPPSLSDGLYAHYLLNGTAQDSGDNSLDGIITTNVTPACDRFGQAGMALRFNGTSSYARVANFAPSHSAFSASVWVKPDSPGPLQTFQNIISKHGYPYDVEVLVRRSVDGKYSVRWTVNGIAYCIDPSDAGVVEPSYTNWDFIVAQYTGSNIQFYVNAKLIREQRAIGSIAQCRHPLTFGAYASYPEIESFVGLMDDIRFYNRALSFAEITALYATTTNSKTLTVSGALGSSTPANGAHAYAYGATVSASTESPIVDGDGAARHVCTGATVEGNACTQLSETNLTLTVTNDLSITWNWKRQYHLAVETNGNGSVSAADEWQDSDAEVLLSATPATGWFFGGWEGDTESCVVEGSSIRVTMTGARALRAVFIERIDTPFETFAAWPENVPLNYLRNSGAWWYSNEYEGLYCEPPKAGDAAAFQITVTGPGIVTFEWELSGADGTNGIFCSVGSQTRGVLKTALASSASVAVPAGRRSVQWSVKRGPKSPAPIGVLRMICWEPLPQSSTPLPASGSTIQTRKFSGLAWSGQADYYRVSSGLTSANLRPVGGGVYTNRAVLANMLSDRVAEAQGSPIFWRSDAVRLDSFGVEAVNIGPVWNVSVLPDGAPEFERTEYTDNQLVVGVQSLVGPIGVIRGAAGHLSAQVASGALPPGLGLSLTESSLSLSGVPTRSGRYQASVKLSLRTETRVTLWGGTILLNLIVSDLGDAAGNFEGWADGSTYGEGSAKLSVTPKGRISGKLSLHGTNYTFAADSYDGASNGVCFVKTVATQGSRASVPLELSVSMDGAVLASLSSDPDAILALFANNWAERDLAAFAAPIAGTYTVALPDLGLNTGSGYAQLTIMTNGKTQFSGRAANRGRFTFMGNLLVVPSDGVSPDRFFAVVYGALPNSTSARASGGLFGVLEIIQEGNGGNAVEAVIPLRTW